ncbi:MAG: chitobiase/beta-hexosaminidase C-terminal domain-containing protein [candidate division KSB1 bacterium]|nr:chitobiase/beta-hexosaminidase C-terminal domain-containing protein [candidate division KSB1 bacterium]MDZ7341564.1 chitobiase/beta-hexosaminidase C-terminal domain-containing protein [candidate division KSB1 bacterium]
MHRSILIGGVLLVLLFQRCSQKDGWRPVAGDITTRWTEKVRPNCVLPEYPRPQMVREKWKNLNGLWDYAVRTKDDSLPEAFEGKILVPFPIESALSGVKKAVGTDQQLWYRRSFEIPSKWHGQRIILHFGAVDWETRVWINAHEIGHHRGGYDAFSFDITDQLKPKGRQELVVAVWDPVDSGFQPRGKQVRQPGGIWYTSVTGIWQTVWLEPVPEVHIESLRITPNVDNQQVALAVNCSSIRPDHLIRARVLSSGRVLVERTGAPFEEIVLPIEQPRLWSPESPFLYDLNLSLMDCNSKTLDEVQSYFGLRKIGLGKDATGITRIQLNNHEIFMHGFLDQGWWPDGLYTAATDEALRYDIEMTKKFGFNVARKHVKIEPERWYYWCDRLGLLVWQDMPSGDRFIGSNDPDLQRSDESAFQFKSELKAMIDGRYNHPSIVMWVPFNEGWGQFETEGISRWIKTYDPSRLVNNASGWTDRGVGDVHDIHDYPGPARPENEPNRAAVLGEYGGLGLPIPGHTWRTEENWGYRGYQTTEQLTDAYEELTRKLLPLIPLGLCAAIYTQTTDVEIEVNGFMTYDRALTKMDPEAIRRINSGFLSPEIISDDGIFLNQARAELKSSKGGEIRFTVDGSEPTIQSPRYHEPIIMENTTTIKARAFWPDGISSRVSRFTCTRVDLIEGIAVENVQPGLRVNFYEGEWNALPDFTALTPVWSRISSKINLQLSTKPIDFGLRFEGFIQIPVAGIYTFYTNSDDGSRLSIHNRCIVSNDGLHGLREEAGKVALQAGIHPITIDFFQKKGGLGLEVSVKGPRMEKQALPENRLFH